MVGLDPSVAVPAAIGIVLLIGALWFGIWAALRPHRVG